MVKNVSPFLYNSTLRIFSLLHKNVLTSYLILSCNWIACLMRSWREELNVSFRACSLMITNAGRRRCWVTASYPTPYLQQILWHCSERNSYYRIFYPRRFSHRICFDIRNKTILYGHFILFFIKTWRFEEIFLSSAVNRYRKNFWFSKMYLFDFQYTVFLCLPSGITICAHGQIYSATMHHVYVTYSYIARSYVNVATMHKCT